MMNSKWFSNMIMISYMISLATAILYVMFGRMMFPSHRSLVTFPHMAKMLWTVHPPSPSSSPKPGGRTPSSPSRLPPWRMAKTHRFWRAPVDLGGERKYIELFPISSQFDNWKQRYTMNYHDIEVFKVIGGTPKSSKPWITMDLGCPNSRKHPSSNLIFSNKVDMVCMYLAFQLATAYILNEQLSTVNIDNLVCVLCVCDFWIFG